MIDESAAPGSGADPLRPSDHVDGIAPDVAADGVVSPRLGPTEWMRWGWRQLTSMRTAIVLLLLLAIAAVPGSIVPQRSADPNGVTQYFVNNPDLAPILDALQLFDVYTSSWFSAIYILLFVSLIGCVIPRTAHHWTALRARPPRTPARLSRLEDYRERVLVAAPSTGSATEEPTVAGRTSSGQVGAAEASAIPSTVVTEAAAALGAHAIDTAHAQLKGMGYRVTRYDGRGTTSVSAERGYLRETGNLVFHVALIGVLLAVGIGGGYTYTGQRVVVEGSTFVNALTDYSSFNPGRFVNADALTPYSLRLDRFDVTYAAPDTNAAGQAGDFAAHVTMTGVDDATTDGVVRVNHPLSVGGDKVYLLGNGYAPTITVKDASGATVFSDSVPFLPQDAKLTSLGVVKVADGLPQQLGMVGFFYPTAQPLTTGALTSIYPDLVLPTLTLNVYAGDLGIDDGTPRSVYTLDTTGMTQLTGGDTGAESVELRPGQSADLPNGWGTVSFDNVAPAGSAGFEQSVKRFVSLSIHRDVAAPWVLTFAVIVVAGLLLALFFPRRRLWVRATPEGDAVRIEYAGLARGEDPTLGAAVDQLAVRHGAALDR